MIGFIDTEVNIKTKRIQDIGCLKENNDTFHSSDIKSFIKFAKKIDFFCGHNIVRHDFVYLKRDLPRRFIEESSLIDTLYISTLLFPELPYHRLVKDDKLDTDSINNPLNDSKTCSLLFYDEVNAFSSLNENLKDIYYSLLKDTAGFTGFFKYLKFSRKLKNIDEVISSEFYGKLCENAPIADYIKNNPVELSYCLALIGTDNIESLMPSWILNTYPKIEEMIVKLRHTPCNSCAYCDEKLDAKKALKRYFGFESFNTYNGVPLQEKAVKSAIKGESLIAVFPTGGGKSLTYQLPALMSRDTTRGLTVVISPLQSLMKDQVDNLEDKNIISAVTINGLLDPIQRAKAIEQVANGIAGILYIAPESLRSKTIERLLINRHVTRFVIDEAHCFSSWGQDFRVDYLYIGDFIKHIQDVKNHTEPIPVSCFTATAKQGVITDIKEYFKNKLNMDLKLFETSGKRDNLKYKVYEVKDDDERYSTLRNIILQENCPTIIYASRRKHVELLYDRLKNDQFLVSRFHGGMEKDEKVLEQDKFMHNQTTIMVATSAFGMGVDKKDVGCVIHYEVSSSLEDYVQESGRAGRDIHIHANCYILYNEVDLNKHFDLINESKLHIKEIQQIWRAVKELTRTRDSVSQSALEIAKQAGWDENMHSLSTRVTTAIAALEDAGYLRRGQNSPRVFANSILAKSVIEANAVINSSTVIPESDIELTKRVVQSLISSKYNTRGESDIPETRVDYLSDVLGVDKGDVIRVVNYLRELKILTDNKDLQAFIRRTSRETTTRKNMDNHVKMLELSLSVFNEKKAQYNLKEINDLAIEKELNITLKNIKMLINYMGIMKWIDLKNNGKDNVLITYNEPKENIQNAITKISRVAEILLNYLYKLVEQDKEKTEHAAILFSILELKEHYNKQKSLLDAQITNQDVEDALYFMQKVGAIQIEGGFMVIYSPLNLERLEKNTQKQYTKADYFKLETFYKQKVEQVHIVGEYAEKMIKNYNEALTFVDDYFKLEYKDFLSKYFAGERKKEIERNMSPARFNELFGSLTPEQLAVIKDKDHQRIAVAAGPGSGKTKLLVHKLASILLTEDIRHEQLLMLTFSRAAVTEFKQRLQAIIGNAANYIDIKTFHSFCFDVLGRVGTLDKTENIITETLELIRSGDVEPSKITKMVLVIDEAQDMNKDEVELIEALITYNENLRVIAVGDDDQNIFEFRGSSSDYFKSLSTDEDAFHELSINFRSKKNLVEFSNIFVKNIPNRLKHKEIVSYAKDSGIITITSHPQTDLVLPIVEHLEQDKPKGRTCMITRTNEQATQIAGLLKLKHNSVSLIQSNDTFNIYHIIEIRSFIDTLKTDQISVLINMKMWQRAINQLSQVFSSSSNLSLALKILNAFIQDNQNQFYLSDLEAFIYESNLSDFLDNETILVSTFHKAKGKEFDNVYILYDNYRLPSEDKRFLYVGMTRAKENLHIHYCGTFFDTYKVDNLSRFQDNVIYDRPDRLLFELNHRDVNLGYYKFVQHNIKGLMSGQKLELDEDYLTADGKRVLKFSKKQMDEIKNLLDSFYQLTSATIKYILYWKDVEENKEYLIVLPELTFDKIEMPVESSHNAEETEID